VELFTDKTAGDFGIAVRDASYTCGDKIKSHVKFSLIVRVKSKAKDVKLICH